MDDLVGGDWLAWKQHPKTREFVALINEEVTDMQLYWLKGNWVSSDAHQTVANSLRDLGVAQGYARVVDVIENIKLEDQEQKK